MANALQCHSLATWLGVCDERNARPAQLRRIHVGKLTMELLAARAPDIARLDPDAVWTPDRQAEVRTAIKLLPTEPDQRDVHNAVAHVIAYGKYVGIWSHQPWPLRAVVQLAPSRIKRADIEHVRQGEIRRTRLIEALPDILTSSDENILVGALMVCAVDLSAIVQVPMLRQLLDRKIDVVAASNLVWSDLKLGDPDHPWRNVRRWMIDPVSQLIIARLKDVQTDPGPRKLDERRVLRAIALQLDLPVGEISLSKLIRSARAWWALQLPSFLHDYILRPIVAPSLPCTAWQRLISGKPLSKVSAPLPVRALPRTESESTVADDPEISDAERKRVLSGSMDGALHRQAINELMKALRQPALDKKLNARAVDERLSQWEEAYSPVGGWVAAMGYWVRETLFDRKEGPFGRGNGPRVAGLLRYLEGFASRFIKYFWDRPLGQGMETSDWSLRLEMLRRDLAGLMSVSVAKSGLVCFLRHAERYGVPPVEFGEAWSSLTSPSDADANLLTPVEYVRLKAWLRAQFPGAEDSYPAKRVDAMSTLAFRLGPRWEELSTLRLRDVVLTSEKIPRGSVWIRRNDFIDGKVREFRRTLSIEQFLTAEERQSFGEFVALAKTLRGKTRPEDDLVFADPGCLSLPPDDGQTHDLIQSGMRDVSGDPSLVFHHLRHSTASFAFLRIMSDESQDPNPYPWLAGWSDISAQNIIGAHESYATVLIGRNPEDASRLYAISELLGHLDPESTVVSYIHFLDVVLGARVAARISLPIKIQAAIDGVQTDSIRRRRLREKDRCRESEENSC